MSATLRRSVPIAPTKPKKSSGVLNSSVKGSDKIDSSSSESWFGKTVMIQCLIKLRASKNNKSTSRVSKVRNF
jgi:hypothetical protein